MKLSRQTTSDTSVDGRSRAYAGAVSIISLSNMHQWLSWSLLTSCWKKLAGAMTAVRTMRKMTSLVMLVTAVVTGSILTAWEASRLTTNVLRGD